MRRRLGWALAMVALPLAVTGCWDQRPIEQQSIVVAAGLSPPDSWTFLLPNVAVSIGSLAQLTTGQQFFSVSVRAPTWPQAVSLAQRQLERSLAAGELQMFIVDRHLSSQAVTQAIDALNMDGAIPATVWLVASTVAPSRLLGKTSPQSVVPYYYLATYFDCHRCHALSLAQREWEWWAHRQTPGVTPYLPLARPTATGVDIKNLLVYPPAGPPLLMPQRATEGWAFLTGHVRHLTLAVRVDGQRYVVSRLAGDASTRVRLLPRAVESQSQVAVHGVITAAPAGTVINRRIERAIQQAVAAAIRNRCLEALAWANRTHTDPFGFAKRAAWLHPSLAERLPPAALARLPIRGRVLVTVQVSGEGVVR